MIAADLRITSTDTRNVRAEDGFQRRTPWTTLCEGILIPLGALTMVFLAMVALMLTAA